MPVIGKHNLGKKLGMGSGEGGRVGMGSVGVDEEGCIMFVN